MKIRFAIVAGRAGEHDMFAELVPTFAKVGLDIEPAFVPSYAALYGILQQRVCELGWAPPLVARDLLFGCDATPVALVLRNGTDTYYSAIVARPDFWHIGRLARAKIGWVSRLSAAGYVVPRVYLYSINVPLVFAKETFHYTHARTADALASETVDAIATYAIVRANKALHVPLAPSARVLAVAGPIPGELVVAATGVDPEIARAARRALRSADIDPNGALAQRLSITGFNDPPDTYVDFLSRWDGRPRWSASEARA